MADWPDGPSPLVDEFQVAHLRENGQLVAVVRMRDALGNVREVRLTERATWMAVIGLHHVLRQEHQPPMAGNAPPPR